MELIHTVLFAPDAINRSQILILKLIVLRIIRVNLLINAIIAHP